MSANTTWDNPQTAALAPPIPNFFIINFVYGNVTCDSLANPDIAGIGVLLSFVISAIASTAASIIATILDTQTGANTKLLPKLVQRWMSEGISEDQLKKRKLWRKVLSRLILALADQQLVTGIALLVSAYIILPSNPFNSISPGGVANYQDAYFTLVVYLCCLASSTHLACIIILTHDVQEHPSVTKARIVLIILFSILLSVSIILNQYAYGPFFRILYIVLVKGCKASERTFNVFSYLIPIIAMLYLFWVSTIQLAVSLKAKITDFIRLTLWPFVVRMLRLCAFFNILQMLVGKKVYDRLRGFAKNSIWFILFSTPQAVFVLQIFFAIISLVFTLVQKFATAPEPNDNALAAGISSWCSLNNSADNKWGFGQSVAMFLLFLPVLSTFEVYLEEKQKLYLPIV